MASKFTHHERRRILKEELRFKTAKVLHEVYAGAVKMVAANRPPHGVTDKRVYRETAGDDANRLELLCEDLDRIVVEKGPEAVLPVLAFFAARYGPAEGAGDGVIDELAAFERAHGEGCSMLLELMADGVDEDDLPKVAEVVAAMKQRLDAVEREWKQTVEAKKFTGSKSA